MPPRTLKADRLGQKLTSSNDFLMEDIATAELQNGVKDKRKGNCNSSFVLEDLENKEPGFRKAECLESEDGSSKQYVVKNPRAQSSTELVESDADTDAICHALESLVLEGIPVIDRHKDLAIKMLLLFEENVSSTGTILIDPCISVKDELLSLESNGLSEVECEKMASSIRDASSIGDFALIALGTSCAENLEAQAEILSPDLSEVSYLEKKTSTINDVSSPGDRVSEVFDMTDLEDVLDLSAFIVPKNTSVDRKSCSDVKETCLPVHDVFENVQCSEKESAERNFHSAKVSQTSESEDKNRIEFIKQVVNLEKKFISQKANYRQKYLCSLCSRECYDDVSIVFHALSKNHLNCNWVRKHTVEMMEDKLQVLKFLSTLNVFPDLLTKATSMITVFIKQERKKGKNLKVELPSIKPEVEHTVSSFNHVSCNEENIPTNAIVISGSSSSSLQTQFLETVGNRDRSDFEIECGTCGGLFQVFNDDIGLSLDMHFQNDPQHSFAVAVPLARDAQNVSKMCKTSSSKLNDAKCNKIIKSKVSQVLTPTQGKTDRSLERNVQSMGKDGKINSNSSKVIKSLNCSSDKYKVLEGILNMESMYVVTDGNTYCCRLCAVAFKSDSQIVHHFLCVRHLSEKWASLNTLKMLEEKLMKVKSLLCLKYGNATLKNAVKIISSFVLKQEDTEQQVLDKVKESTKNNMSKTFNSKFKPNTDVQSLCPNNSGEGVTNIPTASVNAPGASKMQSPAEKFFCEVCKLLMETDDQESHLEGMVHKAMLQRISESDMC